MKMVNFSGLKFLRKFFVPYFSQKFRLSGEFCFIFCHRRSHLATFHKSYRTIFATGQSSQYRWLKIRLNENEGLHRFAYCLCSCNFFCNSSSYIPLTFENRNLFANYISSSPVHETSLPPPMTSTFFLIISPFSQ